MEEKWKKIEGFPGYSISNRGRVISYLKNREILMKFIKCKKGYLRVKLWEKGTAKMFAVHQLVIKHFGPEQPPNTTPDHINRMRDDNRIENLRWATPEEQKENTVYSRGESHLSAKLTESQVIEIKGRLKQNESPTVIAKEFGVSHSTVSGIKFGRKWTHLK